MLVEYLVVLIFRFIAQFIKTNKIDLTVLLCRFKDFKDARQVSRTFCPFFKDQGHSEILKQIQGRFLRFKDVWLPYCFAQLILYRTKPPLIDPDFRLGCRLENIPERKEQKQERNTRVHRDPKPKKNFRSFLGVS